ncbi:hypothetical protein PVK06_045247 [Gossypium arboreum]|uniref:Uncharacterized protein n=1 Tax=Gossypium arboreum TaxID=29729 RepID=A0ABR0MTL3_GOSAR|nr:hypothetical protein PVK06_045247 [Gossypium arboreum]
MLGGNGKNRVNFLVQKEDLILEELEIALHREELLWKQKAKCDWLHLGDRNAKFYHFHIIQRKKKIQITALNNESGEWIYDTEELQSEAVKFFSKLYGESPSQRLDLPAMGDGNNIHSLKDNWIPKYGPLANQILLLDMDNHLKDMVTKEGGGTWIFFYFASSHPSIGQDKIAKARSRYESFSIRSAYTMPKEGSWN